MLTVSGGHAREVGDKRQSCCSQDSRVLHLFFPSSEVFILFPTSILYYSLLQKLLVGSVDFLLRTDFNAIGLVTFLPLLH